MEENKLGLKSYFPMELNLEIKNFICRFKKEKIEMGESGTVYYLDAASYGNLGDQAIALAIEIFLKNYCNVPCITISENKLLSCFKQLKKIIKKNDLIVLSGGGNMGNYYPRYEAIRRKVIRNFPDNRIIIFPQTIDYTNDNNGKRELRSSVKCYSGHKKLTICAREKKSFDKMSEIYTQNNVQLVPDIVLSLKDFFTFEKKSVSNKTGICLRSDKESVLSDSGKQNIMDMIKGSESSEIKLLSTMSGTSELITDYECRKKAVYNKLKEFSECEVIITDRLHGMIFSILAGVPCIAFDNSNKKLSGVFETIEKSINSVKMVDISMINELPNLIENLKKSESSELNKEQLFENLRELIVEYSGGINE